MSRDLYRPDLKEELRIALDKIIQDAAIVPDDSYLSNWAKNIEAMYDRAANRFLVRHLSDPLAVDVSDLI